jgi:N-acetyl-gamma-glutamylphosphate reductase
MLTVSRTGTTGYIGGDGLYVLYQAHPDWEFSALVRTKEKATQLVSKFPKVRIVYGDLDSADILEEEAMKADIVYRQYTISRNEICSLERLS